MQQPTAYIIDPCLGSATGHWENFDRRFSQELARRGYNVKIFSHLQTSEKIVGGLDIIPIFNRLPFVAMPTAREFADECRLYADDFDKIDRSMFQDGDIFICPTIFPQTMKPLLEWSQRVRQNCKVSFYIIFQFPAATERQDKPSIKRRLKDFINRVV